MVYTGTATQASSTKSPSNTGTSSSTQIPTMAQRPWTNLGAIQMARPLHPLPTHLERWFPKFNPDDDLPAKEHINNFMFSINLNKVVEEDAVVRLFPYTLQGSV